MLNLRRIVYIANKGKLEFYAAKTVVSRRDYTNKVLTVPNALSFTRIASTPLMGYFILNQMQSQAIICFAYAAITDFLDGWIARKFKQESDVGAIMDAIADKLFIGTCFITMCKVDLVPLMLMNAIIIRDLGISGFGLLLRYYSFERDERNFRNILDFKNHPSSGFEPSYLSKVNTTIQLILVGTHLSSSQFIGNYLYDWTMFGFHFIVFNTTVFSGLDYAYRVMNNGIRLKFPTKKG